MTGYSKCCTCGYEWRSGMDGSHSCSNKLKKDNQALRKELEAVKASIPKLKADAVRSVTEQGLEYSVEVGLYDTDWVVSQDCILEYAKKLEES